MPFLLLILLSWQTSAPKACSGMSSPDSILNELSRKLNTLKRLEYAYTREMDYPSQNYHKTVSWRTFYDFETSDTLAGFKYGSR